MAKDFAFDPVTHDLIRDGKGSWQMTSTAATMVQLQMMCHAGECWHDEQLGSFLHDLKRFQAKPELLLPDEAERALSVIVARGRIDSLEVTAKRQGPGRVDVATRFRDTSTGQLVSTFVKPGG